jgi:hypothetical protein
MEHATILDNAPQSLAHTGVSRFAKRLSRSGAVLAIRIVVLEEISILVRLCDRSGVADNIWLAGVQETRRLEERSGKKGSCRLVQSMKLLSMVANDRRVDEIR